MQVIQSLVESGHIVDLMLIFVALEIAAITIIRYRRTGDLSLLTLIANIGAGASLMVALRISLTSGSWQGITVCLLAALVFHTMDIAFRWENLTGAGQRSD
jgi:CBS-domain-containing membrane protein